MGFFDSVSFTAHGVSPWETSELREVFPHGVRLGMYGLGITCTSDAVYTDWSRSQMQFCMHSSHAWMTSQLCCALNKDTGSNDDDWLKYPIILFSAVLQSLLIPHFLEAMFLQSWKTTMRNGYLWFFVVNAYLHNDAVNQLLLCAEIMCRHLERK